MKKYSIDEKIEELENEIHMRRKVYKRQVENYKMRPKEARRKLDLMRSIRKDYIKAKESNEGVLTPLFDE